MFWRFGGGLDVFEQAIEGGVERGIQFLFGVAEGAEPGPDFAHGVEIEGGEGADGLGGEVEVAGVGGEGIIEFFVAEEEGTGDDVGAILEEDQRSGVGFEAADGIAEASAASGEVAQEEFGLHGLDGAAAEAWGAVAHGEDADRGGYCGHAIREYPV